MKVILHVDGQKVELNQFANKIFSGIIDGAVKSLRGVDEDWREVRIQVTKSNHE